MDYTGLGVCQVCGLTVPLINGRDAGNYGFIDICSDHPDQKGIQCEGYGKAPAERLDTIPEVFHWIGFYGDWDTYGVSRVRFVQRDGTIRGFQETISGPFPSISDVISVAKQLNNEVVRPAHQENMPVLYVVGRDSDLYTVVRLAVWGPGHKPEDSWHRQRTFLSHLGFQLACLLANNANRNIL